VPVVLDRAEVTCDDHVVLLPLNPRPSYRKPLEQRSIPVWVIPVALGALVLGGSLIALVVGIGNPRHTHDANAQCPICGRLFDIPEEHRGTIADCRVRPKCLPMRCFRR
jgi:hypothetical protein